MTRPFDNEGFDPHPIAIPPKAEEYFDCPLRSQLNAPADNANQ
jgi:hypothetical protein